jgi:superoxide dismutase, Fe-Mn family
LIWERIWGGRWRDCGGCGCFWQEKRETTHAQCADLAARRGCGIHPFHPSIHPTTHTRTHSTQQQGYATKFNEAAAATPALLSYSLPDLLSKATVDPSLPASARTAARNQAGGFANHASYFRTLGPGAGASTKPEGKFADLVSSSFGSQAAMTAALAKAAAGVFGSGWAWLTFSPTDGGKLFVETTANQDNPLMAGLGYSGATPILGVDVWEHSYYVDRGPNRTAYIEALLGSLANWTAVGENVDAAVRGDVEGALLGKGK